MKKILMTATAVAMMAGAASAVTLQWGTNTSSSPFYMTQLSVTKSTAATFNATYALVLVGIGNGSTDGITGLYNTFSEVGTATHATKTTQLGQIQGSSSITGGAALNGTQVIMMLKSGADYFFLDYYGEAGSKVGAYTFSGIVDDSTSIPAYYPLTDATPGVTVGAKYEALPVPEPATGMLALAGAAMLLRRRRRA